jgi:ABC-2 type transport system ATP-binding protein
MQRYSRHMWALTDSQPYNCALMDYAVETFALSKAFVPRRGWRRFSRGQPVSAVEEVSLQVALGETFGLLGPNGAGKTTLVKMLCTLILPTAGAARVAGHNLRNPAAIRAAVGLVVTDERSFYWRLTGRQNLDFFAAMHALPRAAADARIAEVLDAVELSDRADAPFSHYSTGMRQRLAMARGLLHRPQILFLDEPTRSLDPVAQARLHRLLGQLARERGVTVFLITHDLAEAEKLCDRVAVMHKGQVRIAGTPAELRRQLLPRQRYQIHVRHWSPETKAGLQQWLPDLAVEVTGSGARLRFEAADGDGLLDRVLDYLTAAAAGIDAIEGQPPSLEDVFADVTREA